jgi:hypothetical protein
MIGYAWIRGLASSAPDDPLGEQVKKLCCDTAFCRRLVPILVIYVLRPPGANSRFMNTKISVGASLIAAAWHLLSNPTLQASEYISWGQTTNGLRAGIHIQKMPGASRSNQEVVVYIGAEGHKRQAIICPDSDEIYLPHLVGPDGLEVAKTKAGKRIGGHPRTTARLSERLVGGPNGWRLIYLEGDNGSQVGYFTVSDLFKRAGPGVYKLKVQVRLYIPRTNEVLGLIELPEVTVEVALP